MDRDQWLEPDRRMWRESLTAWPTTSTATILGPDKEETMTDDKSTVVGFGERPILRLRRPLRQPVANHAAPQRRRMGDLPGPRAPVRRPGLAGATEHYVATFEPVLGHQEGHPPAAAATRGGLISVCRSVSERSQR
jgi:hypothetical protein